MIIETILRSMRLIPHHCLKMSSYDILFQLVVYLVLFVIDGNTTEPVKLTLLAGKYIYNDGSSNLQYQCYVSEPGIDVENDVTMTSSRYVWTRDTGNENPDPPAASFFQHSDWPRYRVRWANSLDNDVTFGVFTCTAKISEKKDTLVSHIRMRSDADIVPTNGLLSQTFNINDTGVHISVRSPTDRDVTMFRWNKDNVLSANSLSNYTISRPVQLDDAGVYECYIEGERNFAKHTLNLLIVRACPATLWGLPACTNVCNSCYNGGICDENNGECVCPPGFKGNECKETCGFNRFGDDCEFRCSKTDEAIRCEGNLFCLRHPYGCRCNTGFKGVACDEECDAGTYGASCLQTCHCDNECNGFTGICSCSTGICSCSTGWRGSNCQECDKNFYGSDCSKECHCDSESCNRESGLCQSGGCLEQWIDLFPPFRCQTGLINITYTKQNPGIPGNVTCVTFEGPGGDLDILELIVSRDQNEPDMNDIRSVIETKDGSTKTQTFLVSDVNAGDELYCQLRENKTMARIHVTADVYILPILDGIPELVPIIGTLVTIRWSPWLEGTNDGDGPLMGYTLYYMDQAVSTWSMAGYVSAVESPEYTFTDLEPETNYSLSVAAVREGEGGEGPKGPSQYATTLCKVPLSPLDISAEVSGGEHLVVNISWKLPNVRCSSGVKSLAIYYESVSNDNDKGNRSITDARDMTFTFTDLSRDVVYEIYMTLTTSGGESERSVLEQVSTHQKESPSALPPIISPSIKGDEDSSSTLLSTIIAPSIVGCFVLILIMVLVVIVQRKRKQRPGKSQKFMEKGETSFGNRTRVKEDVDQKIPHIEPPVYDNVQRPAPIPLVEFPSYVEKCQKGPFDVFKEQFMLLKHGKHYQSDIGGKEENKIKNRFKNMLPYDHSRVVLESEGDDPHSDYYNANYIKGLSGDRTFIACQGPNKASLDDFWRMVWQESVLNIVMLTNLIERGKDRCLQYWPKAEKETKYFGEINVTWQSSEKFADYHTRIMTVVWSEEIRTIRIFHFLTWPDMDIPEQPTPLLVMIKKVKFAQENVSSPLVVHCSAGIGRTGTFIGLYTLLDHIIVSDTIDVFDYVEEMREYRIDMIQRPTQYAFLHECLLEEYLTGKTWIPRENMDTWSLDKYRGKLVKQIKIHSELERRDRKHTSSTPTDPDRVRFPDVTPLSGKLLYMESVGKINADGYINAFTVDSYRRRQDFILTQSPLPNTVEDFWRLVFDWKCSLIVMLNQLDPSDETCVQYWPDRDVVEYGYMTVELINTDDKGGYSYKQVKVSHVDSQRQHDVRHLHINTWDKNNLSDILNFIQEVAKLQTMYSSDTPTLLHCINSVGRSGVFLCVKSEMERVKAEGKIDIFNTVRQLRASNRHFVESEEDYMLCHQLLKQHICPASMSPASEPPIYANVPEL